MNQSPGKITSIGYGRLKKADPSSGRSYASQPTEKSLRGLEQEQAGPAAAAELSHSSRAAVQALLQTPLDAVYILDADGRVIDLNDIAATRLGKPRAAIADHIIWDFFPPHVVRFRKQLIDGVFASGSSVRFEDERDGVWNDTIVYAIADDDGRVICVVIVAHDITESRIAERELRRSTRMLENAQRMARVGNWDVDLTLRTTRWSDELYRILGYAPGEVEPTVDFFANHVHSDDLDQFLNRTKKHGVGDYNLLGTQAEYRLIARDGTQKWVIGNTEAEYDTEGNICRISGTVQDITDRRQMEEVLRCSEEKFRSLFMGSGEGIVLYDSRWRIIGWNKAMERITGRAEHDFLSKYAWDMAYEFLPDDQKNPALLDMLKAKHASFVAHQDFASGEFMMFVGDGAARTISYTTFKIPAGAEFMYGSILRDITDRKMVEIERERLIAELTDALAQIKTLKGLLPICSSCKKIRDDRGYWNTLELYIMEHSEAEFTHGICPDCIRKYFLEACEED
ncbi:MAG: PAS domain S-box protein [Deltaproteobacteria bacterium]|nr:PAS domain S-box protein [Deltaproteobacteria bacterium]